MVPEAVGVHIHKSMSRKGGARFSVSRKRFAREFHEKPLLVMDATVFVFSYSTFIFVCMGSARCSSFYWFAFDWGGRLFEDLYRTGKEEFQEPFNWHCPLCLFNVVVSLTPIQSDWINKKCISLHSYCLVEFVASEEDLLFTDLKRKRKKKKTFPSAPFCAIFIKFQ